MTVDIHGWIEVRQFKNESEFYPVVKIDHFVESNYKVFAYLFGIRNDFYFKPKFAGRGLPKYSDWQKNSDNFHEKSETIKDFEQWGQDAHSPTYATYKELKEILPQLNLINNLQGWLALFAIMSDLNSKFNDEDIRLVIWFDN